MRSCCNTIVQMTLALLLCQLCMKVQAYDLRQYSNNAGLSNSYVPSLYQDNSGVLWIGTCDGLNVFDGQNVQLYSSFLPNQFILSGNYINKVIETGNKIIWVQTNYGLDRLDTDRGTSRAFTEFRGETFMAQDRDHNLFVMKEDGYVYCNMNGTDTFRKVDMPKMSFRHVFAMTIDMNDVLWVFAQGDETQTYQIQKGESGVTLTLNHLFKHPERLRQAFVENEAAYLIDETYALYEYDYSNRQQYYIADLRKEMEAHGELSAVIKQKNDYYLGFKNSGLTILKYMADQKQKYEVQVTEIHAGVFCLMKDRFQDIVWVGTDGQGVYMYYNDAFSLTNTLLENSTYQLNNPVRALYYDYERTLWVGTKGGGILRIRNYKPGTKVSKEFDRLTSGNSALADNSVYCFAEGNHRHALWIGTEDGVNYYSYREKAIKRLPVVAGGREVRYVHSIYEVNDTTLWIATAGEGMVKVILRKGGEPLVRSAECFVIDKGRMASNNFFTAYRENDSIVWFGNRGDGVCRMNIVTGRFRSYRLDDVVKSQAANDVFAIYKRRDGYWLGTGAGLLHFKSESLRMDNGELLSGGTVHGILEDGQGNLWASTNQGLIRVNPHTHTEQVYNKGTGLTTTEFSDGAFYKDAVTGVLFFGGTNGFVAVESKDYEVREYMPKIQLKGLSIFGKRYNINEFVHRQGQEDVLRLDYDQNFFAIDFMALDYINGSNYAFAYKLERESEHWIESGAKANATFSNLAPGKYILLVKYRNNITGKECQPLELVIRILPPWYASPWAYTGYAVLLILMTVGTVCYGVRQYRRRQQYLFEKLDRQKKEAIYESKLRFFTNITHEFCTPLTLIYGPCEKILAYNGTDTYIRRYGKMIQQNAVKLNDLIRELLEFRRLETDNQVLHLQPVEVSEKLADVAGSFDEAAERHKVDYRQQIAPGITWNTDLGCLNKIVGNLISNAFKYTPDGGDITVTMTVEDERLVITVANSGKGISAEDLPHVFDRYRILDAMEMSGEGSRMGLGLAICKSMVSLLQGEIEVDSVPDTLTTFTVRLPQQALVEGQAPPIVSPEVSSELHLEEVRPQEMERVMPPFDAAKRTLLVIEDEPAMLWLVSDIFADTYNVEAFDNAKEALAVIEKRQPDLIISDVMMPGIDGLTFVQKLKSNKLYNHIPLVLLSALNHEDDQVKGLEAGAEAYVTKPFNIQYLKKIVESLIKREEDLKEFYRSAFSTFKVESGSCLHQDDLKFLEKIASIIERELSNQELSVETISSELGYSTRQFYRRLKPITDKSPADMIKEARIAAAAQMLLGTNLTIEEVIDKVGFINRATFYRLFSQCYGMPPKKYREEQKKKVREENRKGIEGEDTSSLTSDSH